MIEIVIEHVKNIFERQDHHSKHLERIERNQRKIMSNIKDLNDAIAALPQKIVDEIIPLIPAAPGGGTADNPTDTTVQVEALAKVPGLVSSAVAAAIAANTVPNGGMGAPAPLDVTNADGSITTTTYNTDGSVASVVTKDASGNIIENP